MQKRALKLSNFKFGLTFDSLTHILDSIDPFFMFLVQFDTQKKPYKNIPKSRL